MNVAFHGWRHPDHNCLRDFNFKAAYVWSSLRKQGPILCAADVLGDVEILVAALLTCTCAGAYGSLPSQGRRKQAVIASVSEAIQKLHLTENWIASLRLQ
jgi:threonyl-tRNA synthetase